MRISTLSTFQRVLAGMRGNQLRAVTAQEQIASGRRILRPSDDPSGASQSLVLRRQLADIGRNLESIARGRELVDLASSNLEGASTRLIEARELMLQALNGTASASDRAALATQFEGLRQQLLDVGNANLGGRFLFGGTATSGPPFAEVMADGSSRIVYQGSDQPQVLRAAPGVELAVTTVGSRFFGPGQPTGTRYEGLTGIASGVTADQGSGTAHLVLRHDATDLGAAVGAGIALVNGGADDTLLGANDLVIDTVAGTIQLGNGPVVPLPDTSMPEAQDVVVKNELGGELHLDLSGFSGSDFTGVVTGEGSASLDGTTFTPLTFTETDLELRDAATGTVVHVDTTGVLRADTELVTFEGTVSVFDLLQGIADDLRNEDGRDPAAVTHRLRQRLEDLDRAHDDILVGVSDLGLRSQRLQSTARQREDVELTLESLLSSVEDVDLTEAAMELAQAELVLQLAQSSGARIIQSTLLNFL